MRIFTVALSIFLSFFISNVALASTSVPGGDLSGDTTWTLTGSPYVVTSDVNVPAGVTLNVEPGVIVKFTQSFATLNVEGTLNTFGTDLAPVIFTSYKDDSFGGDTNGDGLFASFPHYADWRGVIFFPGSVGNITHTGIYYAGQSFCSFTCFSFPSVRNDGGTVAFDHVGLTPGAPYIDGLGTSDGSTTIVDSQITSARSGIVVSGGSLSIHGSTIAGFNYALRNDSGVNVDATNNWWGDASGPQHVSNPTGTGARVLGDVTVLPFLSADPFAMPSPTSTLTPSSETGYANDATNLTIEPNAGNASSTFTFKVVYTNSANQAPTNVRMVMAGDNPDVPCQAIVGGGGGGFLSNLLIPTAYAAEGDGCAMDVDTTASSTLHDGNYANGEQYVIALQLPVGNLTYHFEADSLLYPSVDEFAVTVSAVPAGCTVNCNSNVLFLPGLEASRLYKPNYSGGTTRLWEPEYIHDNSLLNLDGSGVPLRDDIYTKDVLDNGYFPIKGNIYASFINSMNQMKSDGLINDWKAAPYDWRLSLENILDNGSELSGGRIYYSGGLAATGTPYIIQELRRLAATSRTGKVTIVAHSNGGLVTKALTDKLGPEAATLIDQIIFVAVPQVGTPQAVGAILHGYDQGLPFDWFPFFFSSSEARDLAKNMPSSYNLLPSASYFTYVDDPVVTFDNSALLAPWRARYGNTIHSAERLHTFIADQSRITLPVSDNLLFPISGNESLLNNAETLHNTKLDNWTPPAGVQLTEIAGWGEKTAKTIEYYQGRKTFCSTPGDLNTCIDVPALEYNVKDVFDGDGTVIVPSALWTATSTGARKYWVDLLSYGESGFLPTIDRKHSDILEVPSLRSFIQNIITKSNAGLPEFISSTTPINNDSDTRLRFTLHSPLSLDLYDNLGNHTGISTTTGFLEENIRGSRYKTYGELKYIEAPASTTLRLVMNGYASGSFTLDIDKSVGDSIIASTTFAAIPSSTSTVATITIPQGGSITNASPLSVDEDGNGTPDITLTPMLDSIVLPDFTAPHTSAVATGTLGKNNWYTSNVTIRFSATDTGSGVKNTYYSLNGVLWNIYSTSSPLVITNEGSTTILYYSTDNAGNKEATNTLQVKIDKTAPEASITFDPVTQMLKVAGSDTLSSTTVVTTATSSLVTDGAGHTLKVLLTDLKPKTKLGRINMSVTALVYDGVSISLASTTFKYKWATTTPAVTYKTFAAFFTTKSTSTEVHFRPKKSQTIIMTTPVDLDDNDVDDACDARPTKLKLTGMVVPRMDTSKGVVTVNY